MKEHKSFEEYVTRFRELAGLKPDDNPIDFLPKQIPAEEYLTEDKIKELNESSLTRIRQHILNHDITTISAWRDKNENCVEYREGAERNKIFTREEKNERNLELSSALLKKRYGVTYIRGISQEGKQIVQENSYLVVNLNNDEKFIDNVKKLGQYYCQDSVLIKEKNNENAYLIGTNNFHRLGLNKKQILGKFHPGIENELMSKIHGRPFYFGENVDREGPIQFEIYDEFSIGARQAVTKTSEKILNEIFKK